MLLGSCAKGDGDLDEKKSATGEWAAAVELLPAVRELVAALEQERTMAVVEVLGMADAIDLAVEDNAEARQLTDTAVDAFDEAVGDDPVTEETYAPAVDALGGLGDLRSEVDDQPAMEEVATGYRDVTMAVLDANRAAAEEIDDPEIRRGATLFAEGLRQTEVSSSLLFQLIEGLDQPTQGTSEWVASTADLLAEFDRGWSSIEDTAADSPYEPLADTLQEDLRAAGYFDNIPAVVTDGDPIDAEVMRSILLPRHKGWWPFLAGVEDILRRGD